MKEIKGEGEEGEKKEKNTTGGVTRSAFATSMHIPVVADNNDDEDEDDNDSKSGENGWTF
jgi:CobQ-like glutamine amidotransferase family enzyme